MALDYLTQGKDSRSDAKSLGADRLLGNLSEAEKALQELANVFLQQQSLISSASPDLAASAELKLNPEAPLLNMEAKYRALVEQIPAVVFMAYLDKGIG
jgi:Mlc titration factor MtfA (ptsG expression regulator)